MKKFELGLSTFVEVLPNPKTGKTITYDERIRQIVLEMVLADEVGLDFYGIGEHHRKRICGSSI